MGPVTPLEPSLEKRQLDRELLGGVAWTAGAKWATQGLTWLSVFITARLLSPTEFGISEMAAYFHGITTVIAEFGIATTVLQMRNLEDRILSQLHSFSCLACTAIFGVSLLAVPLIGMFFHIENLQLLIAVNNLGFFVTGFQAVPNGLLARDMDYRRLSIAEAAQACTQAVVTVAAAWMGWSYWSLTAGVGVGRLVRGLLLHYWRPVSFARPHWADLGKPLRFGSQVALSRLAWSTYTLSDGIVVGRVLGDSVLGVYRMALNLAAAPAFKVSQLLMGTAAPLFAKVQADLPLMRRYYLIMVEILMLTLLPLMLGLTMVAPEAIPAVLGRQWLNAIVPLQWLAVFMTLRILGILHEQVLISQGLSGFSMRLSMLSLVILPAAFWAAATWFGSSGVAAAWIFLAPVTILPLIIRVLVAIRLPVMDLLRAMLPAAAGCVPMVAALFFLRDWLADRSYAPAAALAVETVGGGAVYLAVLFTGFRPRIMRYLNFLRDVRRDAALPASATATE